jgi:hypothetical protein
MQRPFQFSCLLIIASLLTSCVTAPVETGRFTVDKPERDLAKDIYDLAQQCWAKEYGFFSGDAIIVENKVELDGIVITASRSAPDIGRQEPFMRITVSSQAEAANVRVEEGGFALASKNNFSQDVTRWINGDSTCSK